MIISTPSYIIPGTYAENLEFLNKYEEVKNIELLFYFFDKETQRLLEKEKDIIINYSKRFSYTIHLPEILSNEIFILFEKLDKYISHYIVHCNKENFDFIISNKNKLKNVEQKFLYENHNKTNLLELISKYDFLKNKNYCLDIGHILLHQNSEIALKNLKELNQNIKEIHIHGVLNNKDHKSIINNKKEYSKILKSNLLKGKIINIEVFNKKDFEQSLNLIKTNT